MISIPKDHVLVESAIPSGKKLFVGNPPNKPYALDHVTLTLARDAIQSKVKVVAVIDPEDDKNIRLFLALLRVSDKENIIDFCLKLNKTLKNKIESPLDVEYVTLELEI